MKLKNLLNELEKAEAKTNELDELWNEDPNNEDIAKAWDEAYNAEYEASLKVIAYIHNLAKIDKKVARAMVITHREKLQLIAEME